MGKNNALASEDGFLASNVRAVCNPRESEACWAIPGGFVIRSKSASGVDFNMSPRIKRKMIAGAVAMGFMPKGSEKFDDIAVRSAILKRWALCGGIGDFARYFGIKPTVAAKYLKGAGVKEPEKKKRRQKSKIYVPKGRNVRMVIFT